MAMGSAAHKIYSYSSHVVEHPRLPQHAVPKSRELWDNHFRHQTKILLEYDLKYDRYTIEGPVLKMLWSSKQLP